MLTTTIDAVKAVLKSDPTVMPPERALIVACIRNHGTNEELRPATPPQPDRILSRSEVAALFGRSLRFVDKLATEGVFRKVTLPGRRRGCGFRSREVDGLLAGRETIGSGRKHESMGVDNHRSHASAERRSQTS